MFGNEDTIPPEAPFDLEATSQDGAIALSWNASEAGGGVAGYNLYRSTSTITAVDDMDPLNGNRLISGRTYTDESVENGTTYHYVVTSVDQAGNESSPSAEVTKTPFADPPDQP